MSKERRKKQFERLVTTLYARQSVAGDAGGDQPFSRRQVGKLIQRMAASNSSIDMEVDDDPANVTGFAILERSLRKFGVIVEEVSGDSVAAATTSRTPAAE